MTNKICSHQVEELLDTYIADRNRFLISRARTAYQKHGRGIMLLDLSEAAFNDAAKVDEAPTQVHYRYLSGAALDDMPEDGREMIDGYDPERECIVFGYVALDAAPPEYAFRIAREASPVLDLLRERGDQIREMVKSEYEKRGRGLVLFVPAPPESVGLPELAGKGIGYAAMYVWRDSGHPIFDDDPDAGLLVDGYDPEREFCYIAIDPDRGGSAGRITFDGKPGPPIPGFTDHEDTAHYKVGHFADPPERPTAYDAIFGGKPKRESAH